MPLRLSHKGKNRITDFEQISMIPKTQLKKVLNQFETDSLVTALMGASPDINLLMEDAQKQIVTLINLQAAGD